LTSLPFYKHWNSEDLILILFFKPRYISEGNLDFNFELKLE